MKHLNTTLILATACLLALPAQAGYFVTGDNLASLMNEYEKVQLSDPKADSMKAGQYVGYIRGIVDVYDYKFCIQDGTEDAMVAMVVSDYLKANKKKLHRGALTLVFSALNESFPCKK